VGSDFGSDSVGKSPSSFLSKVSIFVPLVLHNGIIFTCAERKCDINHHTGDEIYRCGTLSIFEVISPDGILLT
jgi:hypothetical protein